jgi:hypothetical protein
MFRECLWIVSRKNGYQRDDHLLDERVPTRFELENLIRGIQKSFFHELNITHSTLATSRQKKRRLPYHASVK